MANILQAELVIKGSDKTAAAFQGVIAHARELQSALGKLGTMPLGSAQLKQAQQEVQRLTALTRAGNSAFAAINSTIALGNRYLQERVGLMTRLKGAFPNAGYLLGPGVLMGTKIAAKSGADIQAEIVKYKAAGIPDDETARTKKQAYDLHGRFPNVGVADILERYKELRSVVLHPDEAPGLLPTIVQAQAALKALDKSGNIGEHLIYAVKAAEVMGLAQHPERFKSYIDAFIRAQQVMGLTISPEEQLNLARNLKSSAATLSDRFKTTVALSMAQEMGGMRAGVGIDQAIKQIVGGFQGNQHSAAKEFVALGLANKNDFERTKTGDIKGFKPGRHVKGAALAASDLDQWVYQYYLPALVAKGITKLQDQLVHVRRDFPNARAADAIAKLIQQRPSFEQHAILYRKATGLSAALDNIRNPIYTFGEMTEALKTFLGTASSPMMETAALALHNLARHLASLAKWADGWQERNPQLAQMLATGGLSLGAVTGGALTYGLFRGLLGGFGLKGSAVALTGSASALNAAAARLGAAGVTNAATAASTVAGGTAVAGLGATMFRGGLIAGGIGLLQMMNRDSETGHPVRSWLRDMLGIEDPHEPAPWQPGGQFHPLTDELLPENRRRFTLDDIRSLGGTPLTDAAKAELTGNAEITNKITVSPSPDFLTRIETMIHNAISGVVINGNAPAGSTTGPTGSSMPEAAPHAGR